MSQDLLNRAQKKQVLDQNIESLAFPQLECSSEGLEWPQVCKLIVETFKNSKINIYLHVQKH